MLTKEGPAQVKVKIEEVLIPTQVNHPFWPLCHAMFILLEKSLGFGGDVLQIRFEFFNHRDEPYVDTVKPLRIPEELWLRTQVR